MIKTPVPITWQNSIQDFDRLDIKNFYANVDDFAAQFNREFPISDMEIQLSKPSKEADFDTENILIKLHVHLANGKTYISTAKHPLINDALAEVIRKIRSQTDRSDHQKHNSLITL